MRWPHDHALAVLDLEGQAVNGAQALLIRLPSAPDRLHVARGQRIADLLGIEASSLLHCGHEDLHPSIALEGVAVPQATRLLLWKEPE